MIDLHCHILPALDDGAEDLADSLGMGRQAEADGVELICATPHIRADHSVRIDELPGRLEELNYELARHGLDVRVVGGGEVAAPLAGELSDDELHAVSLGGGRRWILLEPPAGPLDGATLAAERAVARRGLSTVLAHPERHLGEESKPVLRELVRRGALVQATAHDLVEPPGSAGLLDLAQSGLIHLVGSDSHSSRYGRPLALSAGVRALTAVELVSPHRDWVADRGPRAVIAGEAAASPF